MERQSSEISSNRANRMDEQYGNSDQYQPPRQTKQGSIAPQRTYPTRSSRTQQPPPMAGEAKPRTRRTLRGMAVVQEPPYVQLQDLNESLRKCLSQRFQEMDMEDDFKIIEGFAEGSQNQYMQAHKSNIPIGENCQAEIPPYIGADYFHSKIRYHEDLLEGLLVSKAVTDTYNFSTNLAIFRSYMGGQRNEQQLAIVLKSKELNQNEDSLEEYLSKNQVQLQQFLQNACPKRAQKRFPAKGKKKPLSNVRSNSTQC